MSDHLRQYQVAGADAVFAEWDKGVEATMLDQATGTGKTVVLAEIIRRAQPKRALILAHRRKLVTQARDKIKLFTGLNAEVEMGISRAALGLFDACHAVVSSVQSQTPGRRLRPEDFDILVVDECHHVRPKNKSYMDVINHYRQNPRLKILGLTATVEPGCRSVFKSIAFSYPLVDAITDAYLVNIEPQMIRVHGLDYSHVKTQDGDLHGAQLANVLEKERICQGMAMASLEVMFGVPHHSLKEIPTDKWAEYLFMDGKPKKNLVFTVSVAQAKMMSDIFNRVKPGLSAWVCGDANLVSEEERIRIDREFGVGDLQIVCNCGIYSEGYDNPNIKMITMARPTKSATLFKQQIGRGTRILDGVIDGLESVDERRLAISNSDKRAVLVLDYVGNCGRHSLVSVADVLGDGLPEAVRIRARKKAEKSAKPENMIELLRQSETEIADEKKAKEIEDAARKQHLLARSNYSLSDIDVFERLKVRRQPVNPWEIRQGWSLTDNQKNALRLLGVNPDEISVSCGRQLLGARGPSSAQAFRLRNAGYDPEAFKGSALKTKMAKLAANNWQRLPEDGPR